MKFWFWLMLCVLSVCLSGCIQDKRQDENLVGRYTLVRIIENGNSILEDEIQSKMAVGSVNLQANQTGTVLIMNEPSSITWGNGMISFGSESVKYELKEDVLVLYFRNDRQMEFQKDE